MEKIVENMSQQEKLPLRLRALYRRYGYRFYKVADFEPYDLYRENKNFLADHSVLTFTDTEGRLMALKPDVTISIAKDIEAEEPNCKLFYSEHVFRRLPGANQFTEIKQMGLEYIGADTGYAEAEVVALACQSLAEVGSDYFLGISHMGYISALMDELPVNESARQKLIEALRRKSAGDIGLVLRNIALSEKMRAAIFSLVDLPVNVQEALRKMAEISLNRQMSEAIDELKNLVDAFKVWGLAGHIRLELSLLNDLEYYNGIVFQGYIKGLPRSVLSGGRYDKLLQRFDKNRPALGFALYLNELTDKLAHPAAYDVDTLLIYGDDPPAAVARAVNRLLAQSCSVRAERQPIPGLRARRILRLQDLAEAKEKEEC